MFKGRTGSWPNIRKNDLSLDCSFDRKLYAAQASGTMWSHPEVPKTCLDMLAFKGMVESFNPAI